MRMLRTFMGLAAAAALAGCATAGNNLKIARYGAVDVNADEELVDRAESLPWHKDYPIVVLRSTFPDGISIDDKGKITVDRAVAGELEVLGTVESEANGGSILTSSIWYVNLHPSEGTARDWFCKAQLPLRVGTLSLWSYLTPFGWVCLAVPKAGSEGFKLHVQELRRGAYAMGGNVVVLIGQTDLVRVSSGGTELGRVEGIKIRGLVIKTADPQSLNIASKVRKSATEN